MREYWSLTDKERKEEEVARREREQPPRFSLHLAPALPHTPCRDPERHRKLHRWMWEYQDNVCPCCDPEHLNARGELVWEWLYWEQQRELILIWQEDGRFDLIEKYTGFVNRKEGET